MFEPSVMFAMKRAKLNNWIGFLITLFLLMEATNIFGTAIAPCHGSLDVIAPLSEEDDAIENLDPEKLLQCPFDKSHQIRVCRFPYHLIKCRKNHPELAEELKTCPFNACHLVPKQELPHHTETCKYRVTIGPLEAETTTQNHIWDTPVTPWVNPDTTEDWDKEIGENVPRFAWDLNPMLKSLGKMRFNKTGSTFRAPGSFPWASCSQ